MVRWSLVIYQRCRGLLWRENGSQDTTLCVCSSVSQLALCSVSWVVSAPCRYWRCGRSVVYSYQFICQDHRTLTSLHTAHSHSHALTDAQLFVIFTSTRLHHKLSFSFRFSLSLSRFNRNMPVSANSLSRVIRRGCWYIILSYRLQLK